MRAHIIYLNAEEKLARNQRYELIGAVEEPKRRRRQWKVRCRFCSKEKVMTTEAIRHALPKCYCNLTRPRKFKDPANNTLNFVFKEYRHGAKNRGLPFELSLEEVKALIFANCYYCGEPPSRVIKSKNQKNVVPVGGIDRKENLVGYVKDNCVACCKQCNLLKSTRNIKVFEQMVLKIARNLFYRQGETGV